MKYIKKCRNKKYKYRERNKRKREEPEIIGEKKGLGGKMGTGQPITNK